VSSWALAEEIVEVLGRASLRRKYKITDEDVADILVLLSPLLPTVEMEIAIRDPDDAAVVAAAVSGNAEAIVTGDKDFLEDQAVKDWLEARGIQVLSPTDWLSLSTGT
jgi:putative PIN family toxin of toxin-antitoxin system